MNEHMAGASERLGIRAHSPMTDFCVVQTSFNVQRWDAEQTDFLIDKWERRHGVPPAGHNFTFTPAQFAMYGIKPYSVTQEDNCNLVVQQGWVWLLGGVAGTTMGTKFSATNGRIGAGTSSTAASYTQTFLVGDTGSSSTTSYYQLVSGAPTISTGSTPPTLVFTASFGTGVANFAWNEFGTDNANASGVNLNGLAGGFAMFNRGVSSQGTKASGQTWTATETISFGYPSGSGTVS